MSSQLPSGFAERIRILKSILDEVYPRTFNEWVNSFEVDGNPEQELLIWECITLTYSTFVENRPLAMAAKKEVMNVLLQCSMGMTDEDIQSNRKVLHEAAVQSLLTLLRIPRPFGHPVHAHSATQSTVIRPLIP